MGQCDSKPAPKKKQFKKAFDPTFGKDPSLNMADYMLSNAKNETVVREDMKGQQFVLEECDSCLVALQDTVAALTCDYLTNCVVVTGPVSSSAFIRNCTNCTFVVAAAQFRTRECKNCRFFLYTSTEPIIETSEKIGMGCYDLTYFNLHSQFEGAGLSVWNNKWSEVYDFTPSAGTTNKNSGNWKVRARAKRSERESFAGGSASETKRGRMKVMWLTFAREWRGTYE